MRNVATPMIINEATSIDFRPIWSPKWPMNTPPSGLARKPTVKVEKAASEPAS
jgi:hypothetical protein